MEFVPYRDSILLYLKVHIFPYIHGIPYRLILCLPYTILEDYAGLTRWSATHGPPSTCLSVCLALSCREPYCLYGLMHMLPCNLYARQYREWARSHSWYVPCYLACTSKGTPVMSRVHYVIGPTLYIALSRGVIQTSHVLGYCFPLLGDNPTIYILSFVVNEICCLSCFKHSAILLSPVCY